METNYSVTMNGETLQFARTPARDRRIVEAISECDRYIAREGSRSSDLRPAEVQQTLDKTITHRAKLIAMLA